MPTSHNFGGDWTEQKLTSLEKYLKAYIKIFKTDYRASYYTTTYVDAFAGTGYRTGSSEAPSGQMAISNEPDFDDPEAESFQKGSAQKALEIEPSFDRYLFIEKKVEHAQELEKLRIQFPSKANKIDIVQGEANAVLQDWSFKVGLTRNRAVVFLDPYGMAVEWRTIEMLAQTQHVDLWLLFPLGQAVNRLLMKNRPPEGAWANRLTLLFGTDDWKEAFYKRTSQMSLLSEEAPLEKHANFDQIGKFFVKRLKTIFKGVANNPLPLYNSRNIPIYLLCFAAAHPGGAPIAVDIAQHILRPAS